MSLEKCALCPNTEDPRFGATFAGIRYPLCDGCGGPETYEQEKALAERLAALPPPKHSLVVGDHVRRKGDERVGRVTEIGRSGARISYAWGHPSLSWEPIVSLERMITTWEAAVASPAGGDPK